MDPEDKAEDKVMEVEVKLVVVIQSSHTSIRARCVRRNPCLGALVRSLFLELGALLGRRHSTRDATPGCGVRGTAPGRQVYVTLPYLIGNSLIYP